MRLWHESLLPLLPNPQLLGQHCECCALRGLGWGRPHPTVNYVFDHPYEWLWVYHLKVMGEMLNRGYQPSPKWYSMSYRGRLAPSIVYYFSDLDVGVPDWPEWMKFPGGCYKPNPDPSLVDKAKATVLVYPEHNDQYLRECLDNLANKGIEIPL